MVDRNDSVTATPPRPPEYTPEGKLILYKDSKKTIHEEEEAVIDPETGETLTPRVEKTEYVQEVDQELQAAVKILRGWADQMDDYVVTSGNAVTSIQFLVDRSVVFYRQFANLLDKGYRP